MTPRNDSNSRDRDLYDFMLYKFRSGDQRFIMDIFENDAFLGQSIKKAYRSRCDESLSYDEIAAIVGISVKNVSVRLYRIKEELKRMSD